MTPGKAYLTTEEIRPLAERSNLMGAWLVFHCWTVIALAVALFAIWPNPLTFIIAVMLIGSRQLGLAILMHEAAHNALFKSRQINEFVGEWLCGRPIMAELAAYRHYHLTHHRFTQTDNDPDLVLSSKFPTSHASIRRKFTRDLTGQTGIKQLMSQIALLAQQIKMSMQLAGDQDAIEEAGKTLAQNFKAPNMWRGALVFLFIVISLGIIGEWWWGLAFWLLPYLTWFQFVLRVRNIAEHGATETSDNPLQNVRTTMANPIERLFVAPYWVNYHLEHHMVMHVPCFNLPKMHRALLSKGLGDEMKTAQNYGAALREAGWRSV